LKDLNQECLLQISTNRCAYSRNRSQKSTTRASAQNRSTPPCLEINPQCPPRSGATNRIAGFSSTSAAKNDSYGTNGSSCAVIISIGTRTRATTLRADAAS